MTDAVVEQVGGLGKPPAVEGDTIRLDALRLDGGTQSRDGLDEATIKEYAETMKENGTFEWPAIKVVFDGTNYWLVDGFHRAEAARRASHRYFKAEIVQGTQRDAVLMSTGVNADHGLRRTNADKRRAVETLLRDPEWKQWADREIARRTGTSNRFVGNVRSELAAAAPTPVNESQTGGETRTVQRGGKKFEMQTGNIGADKRGGQGADTWALIEIGTWKFMAGIYYAVDQKRKIIYFVDNARVHPLTAANCEAMYPGCLAVSGASLNSDWQTYRAAVYTFKSPSEFPRQTSYTSDKFQLEWYVTDYDKDMKKFVVYVPGFDTQWEAAAFKAQISSGFLAHDSAMKQYEHARLIQRDSIQKVAAPVETQPVESAPTATNGLTSEVIAKHRRLAEIPAFRVINHKCREAGRTLQKLNFEHGLEAAQIAAKGMAEIMATCANDVVKADKEWQQRLDEANQSHKAKWGRKK